MTSFPRRAERLKVLTISCLIVLSLTLSLGFIGASAAEIGDGHNMPAASLGDREAALMFNIDTSPVIAGKIFDFVYYHLN